MSESAVVTLEKAVGFCLIWKVEPHPFDTLSGTGNSMLQNVTMPDYF